GQLGYGTFGNTPNPTPMQVTGLTGVVSIAADFGYSGGSTVAVRADGTVWAWGSYTFNNHVNVLSSIQVTAMTGIKSVATSSGTTPAIISTSPVRVTGLPAVSALSEGELHTLAVAVDGSVWAWGDNFYHELGNGTNVDNWSPGQVPGLIGMTGVSAGYDDSF